MFQRRLKEIPRQFKLAAQLLISNDPLRLAGATAFFATFALPFILIILVQVLSLLFNRKEISRELFVRMSAILGRPGMEQLVVTIRGFRGLVNGWVDIVAGSLFMMFVATTLFRVIKNSMNQLWMIHLRTEKKFRISMVSRLRSLVLILFTGVLFVSGGLLESLQLLFGRNINELLPGTGIVLTGFLSFLVSVFITTIWFAVLLHFIPDGRPHWKVSLSGALLTSLLFALGKFILKILLVDSNIDQVFGASGSFVLLLLFVFYSAIILYYGAAFTKVWGEYIGLPIRLAPHAAFYTLQDVEEERDQAAPEDQQKS
ncbi:MAG: YihY/virulence factor BrkB family protein [Chitinophagaceae bacterium]|nr:YihY/virulence factor BrkB family protein [Chitinophagaceae bacterium]